MMEERRMKKYIISLVFVLAAGIPVLGQTSYLSEIKIVGPAKWRRQPTVRPV